VSSTKVSLVVRIKLSNGLRRYCQPVIFLDGKLKPFYTDRHYTHTLTLFLEPCKKQYLEELDRRDVLAFMTHLRTSSK
jgi:hypothetical protein